MLTQEILLDCMNIAFAVRKNGLSNVRNADGNSKLFKEKVQPFVDRFKKEIKCSPSVYFKRYLLAYLNDDNRLIEDFESKHHNLRNWTIKSHIWASITKKKVDETNYAFKRLPQLILMVDSEKLVYGLTYGVDIKGKHKSIKLVKKDIELQTDILNLITEDHYIFRNESMFQNADVEDKIEVNNTLDIQQNWVKRPSLLKWLTKEDLSKESINIQETVTNELRKLIDVFVKLSDAE